MRCSAQKISAQRIGRHWPTTLSKGELRMEQEQSIILGALVAVAALASIWWRSSSWRAAAFLTLLLLSFGLVAAYGALSPLPLPQTMFCVAILAVAYSAAARICPWRPMALCADQRGNVGGLRRD